MTRDLQNPRAPRLRVPGGGASAENHILLAEQAGLGVADLARIDVRGLALVKARCPCDAKS